MPAQSVGGESINVAMYEVKLKENFAVKFDLPIYVRSKAQKYDNKSLYKDYDSFYENC